MRQVNCLGLFGFEEARQDCTHRRRTPNAERRTVNAER
jgi:hypothetical protein